MMPDYGDPLIGENILVVEKHLGWMNDSRVWWKWLNCKQNTTERKRTTLQTIDIWISHVSNPLKWIQGTSGMFTTWERTQRSEWIRTNKENTDKNEEVKQIVDLYRSIFETIINSKLVERIKRSYEEAIITEEDLKECETWGNEEESITVFTIRLSKWNQITISSQLEGLDSVK